jgi:simple sugar transport system ATP-binding protein
MMRRAGVSFIPENPLTMASVPFMTVLENLALTNTWRYAGRGGLSMDWQAVKADGQATAERLGFPVSFHALARSLSGGNLQRMIIVREMSHGPRLVIASYLTRGLDVQSAVAARQALIQARASGAGVLLISEDLDELFVLSDRLLVLFAGRIVGEFKPAETDAYQVGHLMTGSKAEHVQDR